MKRGLQILILAVVVILLGILVVAVFDNSILFSPAPDVNCLKSDINLDGSVNRIDFSLVRSKDGCQLADKTGFIDDARCTKADANQDRNVDLIDIALVKSKDGCPIPADVQCAEYPDGVYFGANGEDERILQDTCVTENILLDGSCTTASNGKPTWSAVGVDCGYKCESGACKLPEIIWEKIFLEQKQSVVVDIKETPDGGTIVVGSVIPLGSSWLDVSAIKYDINGDIEWNKSFGSNKADNGRGVVTTNDGGYAIAAESYLDFDDNLGNTNIYVIKLNSQGELEWQKTYGSLKSDLAYDIIQTSDNGFLIVAKFVSIDGPIESPHPILGDPDGSTFVIKLNSQGELEWQRRYNLGDPLFILYYSDIESTTNGYLISATGSKRAYLFEINLSGDITWSYYIANFDVLDVEVLSNNDFYIAEYSYPNSAVANLNRFNGIIWEKNLEEVGIGSLDLTHDGGIIAGGITGTWPQPSKLFITKLGSQGNPSWEQIYENSSGGVDVYQSSDEGYVISDNIKDSQSSSRLRQHLFKIG